MKASRATIRLSWSHLCPKDKQGRLINNRLRYVHDRVRAGAYTEDIDSQTPLSLQEVQEEQLPEQSDDNYRYDAIGNLTRDTKEHIDTIKWNVYGKISSIHKTDGTDIVYSYDASGNRILKSVNGKETWYVRDASGNVMSVYSADAAINSGHLMQSEIDLYGSSRLGLWKPNRDMSGDHTDVNYSDLRFTFERGNKFFELSNHLGNVLATVSDKKIGHSTDGTTIDYYNAEVVTAQDYAPFGMGLVGRKYSIANTNYRYGFNGKELDKETSSTTTYDYGFRIYSPALGKFLSVDPLAKKYPELTPYQFASNSPIAGVDLDGKEFYSVHIKEFPDGSRTKIGVVNYTNIKQKGVINVETKNGYGPQGDVGVNYTIIKVDKDGKEISRTGFNRKNMYGIYQGGSNPKAYWEKPDKNGNYRDEYSLQPINETDANAKQHDLDYDEVHISGVKGVFSEKSTPANEAYIRRTDKTIEKQKTKEKDDITGKPVTKDAANAAKKGKMLFKIADAVKEKPGYNQGIDNK